MDGYFNTPISFQRDLTLFQWNIRALQLFSFKKVLQNSLFCKRSQHGD